MSAQDDAQRLQAMAAIWASPPGWRSLAAVNHTAIAYRFIVTGFAFLLLGGMLAMFMRLQLAWPGNEVLDHARYNQFMTMHGTTMMFLFAVPIMEGFALYLVPKMIGARDVPFPRLTAFGYWCYLFGGLFLYASFLFDAVPAGGWFMYVPLTGGEFTPGRSADFWLLGVTFAEIAAVTAAIELIVAILKTRAPGMSIQRMPLFAWYILVTAFMIALGFPPLILGSVLLEIERAFGFVFYDVARGGDPLLWQHLFWLFGHPEVYIVFLPAAGVVSTLIATFARRPIAGYAWIVLAVIGTGFLSFGLWVHHMFAVGIPLLALSFFSAASMAVSIPMGIQVFAWLATLWHGRPWLRTPLLFLVGFFFVFVLGGLTGVMVALVPFDWQVHDTHFLVAHLHYVTIGGLLFPLFAGAYYWLPSMSGRMPSERLGRAVFWLLFVGFNLTFLPMHLTGLLGMPRRVYTYAPELGVEWLNLTSTVGGFLFAVGVVAFLVDLLLHFRLGERAEPNPWRAGTLEWALPMPPPTYNFASIPRIEARDPLWEQHDLPARIREGHFFLADPASGQRETLGTSVLAGAPEYVLRLPGPSFVPLTTALLIAAFFALFLIGAYAFASLAVLAVAAAAVWWAWRTPDAHDGDVDIGHGLALPPHSACRQAPGWWGTLVLIAMDASLFASLVFAYFYLWLGAPQWPPAEIAHARGGVLAAALLVAGMAAMGLARRAIRRGEGGRATGALLVALAFGVGFVVWQATDLIGLPAPQAHAYASLVHTLTGFHLLHVLVALLVAGVAALDRRRGRELLLRVEVAALWWQYVAVQGLLTLAVVHGFPGLA